MLAARVREQGPGAAVWVDSASQHSRPIDDDGSHKLVRHIHHTADSVETPPVDVKARAWHRRPAGTRHEAAQRRQLTTDHSNLLLVDFTGRLFREGKAVVSADLTGLPRTTRLKHGGGKPRLGKFERRPPGGPILRRRVESGYAKSPHV